jgi:hypothetical protein
LQTLHALNLNFLRDRLNPTFYETIKLGFSRYYNRRGFFRFGHHRQKKIVAQNYQRFKHHFQSKNDKIPKLISGLDGVYSLKRLSSA